MAQDRSLLKQCPKNDIIYIHRSYGGESMANPVNVDYQYILQDLRGDCDYIRALSEMTKRLVKAKELAVQTIGGSIILPGRESPLTEEEAASFFITLAADASHAKASKIKMTPNDSRDIILCTWGLITGSPRDGNMTARRLYYLDEHEKVEPRIISGVPYADMDAVQKKRVANNQNSKEIRICKVISEYFNEFDHPIEYILQAASKNLASKWGAEGEQQTVLPFFSFHKFDTGSPMIPAKCYNLPHSDEFIIGRADELDWIDLRFAHGHDRVILWGSPGIGKTQIALKYARRFRKFYSLIHWINASSFGAIVKAYRVVLEANRRLTGIESDEAVILAYFDFLEEFVAEYRKKHGTEFSEFLIIYDDCCYHTQEEYEAFLNLIPTDLENGRILMTARNAFITGFEHRKQVYGLNLHDASLLFKSESGLEDELLSQQMLNKIDQALHHDMMIRELARSSNNDTPEYPQSLEVVSGHNSRTYTLPNDKLVPSPLVYINYSALKPGDSVIGIIARYLDYHPQALKDVADYIRETPSCTLSDYLTLLIRVQEQRKVLFSKPNSPD